MTFLNVFGQFLRSIGEPCAPLEHESFSSPEELVQIMNQRAKVHYAQYVRGLRRFISPNSWSIDTWNRFVYDDTQGGAFSQISVGHEELIVGLRHFPGNCESIMSLRFTLSYEHRTSSQTYVCLSVSGHPEWEDHRCLVTTWMHSVVVPILCSIGEDVLKRCIFFEGGDCQRWSRLLLLLVDSCELGIDQLKKGDRASCSLSNTDLMTMRSIKKERYQVVREFTRSIIFSYEERH